jgi:imidazole glycerol-phosphate synthase subunit HisH
MRIGIINYSIGNVGSVRSAFDFYGFDACLVGDHRDLHASDLIVLAGVGNFSTATGRLRETGFWDALNEEVLGNRKPVLGICLGMQLFADVSFEDGRNDGLGWIPGEVVAIEDSTARVPHIGWDVVEPRDEHLFEGLLYGSFYYMHSYHFVPADPSVIAGVTRYGSSDIVAAVRHENITGVQFHPEKSQGDGLRVLRNWVEEMSC